MDTVAEQRAFSDKFHLTFPLLADTSGAICDAFRVDHPEGKPRRETFLFENGRLVHHDRAVNPKTQASDVLRKIEELR
jgi:peroxiredoxin Q/BCP